MKILKLTAENFKKLRAVEITPTGELVEITGRNQQGKTSVLDAIWAALANAKHIQAMPIRKGADKARIRLDLGELIVERRFNAAGSTLTVESAEGARFTSPQGILDKLLGALTFDPLAFVNQEPSEQFEALRRIVPLEVDLDQLDGLNRKDFDSRTEINRQAKSLRAQADGIAVPGGLPDAPIDTAALKDRMAKAAKTNAEIEAEHGRRRGLESDANALLASAAHDTEEARRLTVQAAEAGARAELRRDKAARITAGVEALPKSAEPVDADAIRVELDAAEVINRGIDRRLTKATLQTDALALEKQSKDLTETMEARVQIKSDAIAKAPMPVPGLSFGDGVVTFEGVPFGQASSAEQLKVSVAIAMAANPKLKVIRIKEGSLLDDSNVELIAEMAKAGDYQVWLETCHPSGRSAVVIEDGMVVAVDGEPQGARAAGTGDA